MDGWIDYDDDGERSDGDNAVALDDDDDDDDGDDDEVNASDSGPVMGKTCLNSGQLRYCMLHNN